MRVGALSCRSSLLSSPPHPPRPPCVVFLLLSISVSLHVSLFLLTLIC